jgi:hypothetical protein
MAAARNSGLYLAFVLMTMNGKSLEGNEVVCRRRPVSATVHSNSAKFWGASVQNNKLETCVHGITCKKRLRRTGVIIMIHRSACIWRNARVFLPRTSSARMTAQRSLCVDTAPQCTRLELKISERGRMWNMEYEMTGSDCLKLQDIGRKKDVDSRQDWREANHSLLPSAEVKNKRMYTFTPPYVFIGSYLSTGTDFSLQTYTITHTVKTLRVPSKS